MRKKRGENRIHPEKKEGEKGTAFRVAPFSRSLHPRGTSSCVVRRRSLSRDTTIKGRGKRHFLLGVYTVNLLTPQRSSIRFTILIHIRLLVY